MKKLKIVEVDDNKFFMKDLDGNNVVLFLNFVDFDVHLTKNNYIYISEKLLDKNYIDYNYKYYFGPIGSKYGRKIENADNPDILIVEVHNERFYLQRYYG